MLPLRIPAPVVRDAPAIYRPRRPEEGLLYRLLEDRFEEFALVHEERFEREDGPLRPVVRRVVNEFLDCGVPENGFARVRCPKCQAEFFVPFSCQTRNFCASCALSPTPKCWAVSDAKRVTKSLLRFAAMAAEVRRR